MSEITPLYKYGQFLAETANKIQPEGNCLVQAKAILDIYRQTISDQKDLQDTELQCGLVYDVRSYGDSEARSLHASNFLFAKQYGQKEVVGVDGFEAKAWKRSKNCLLPYVDWGNFTDESVVYVQYTYNEKNLPKIVASAAKQLREPGIRLHPNAQRSVVLGEQIATVSIEEFASESPYLNKQKLPVLLLERQWS